MKQVVCFGEVLLRLCAPGQEPLLRSPLLEASPGGAEANVALALAGLGLDTAVVTALPHGPLGDACVGELRRHGVDTRGVLRQPGRLGLYFLTRGAMLRPARVVYDRACSVFAETDPAHYDWNALLAKADWLHVSGVTAALGPGAAQAAEDAMREAGRRGVPVSFDCNFRASLWGGRQDAPQLLGKLAAHAQLLFAGAQDAALLFGVDCAAPDPAEAFRRSADAAFSRFASLRHVAATHRVVRNAERHELTGYLADRGSLARSQTLPLEQIVERIGGGDAYAAGVVYGLCTSLDTQRTVDFATALAALKHSVPGDFIVTTADEVWNAAHSDGADIRR